MPKISVIVPVYNVEQYLHRCVDSILNQTFTDFELILVDDGSPDNCPAICDAYAMKDSRVKVIHQRNGGVSRARNSALNIAQGEYIAFCDSDDSWKSELLEKTYKAAILQKADQIIFGVETINVDGQIIDKRIKTEQFSKWEELNDAIQFAIEKILAGDYTWSVWARLFKRSIIEQHGIRFCENCNNFAEDLGFTFVYTVYCQSVYQMPDILYCYYLRIGSAMDISGEQVRLHELNEVSCYVWRYFLTNTGNFLEPWFGVIHFCLMYIQYKILIQKGTCEQLPCEIDKIKNKAWFEKSNQLTMHSYQKFKGLFGKNNAHRILMFSRYANHKMWKRYSYESGIYYKFYRVKSMIYNKFLFRGDI